MAGITEVWIEMESSRNLKIVEMPGITSQVYDIFNPSPVSLIQLSAIAVSLELWRCKVNKFREEGKLVEFDPSGERVLLRTMLPDLLSVILDTIHEYVARFGTLLDNWLKEHHNRIFCFFYSHQNFVLKYFDDFVCNYTGAIDYLRTAIRMMDCDRFDANQKFVIACTYFFEGDIRRIWPLVSGIIPIDFDKSPQLSYWICCLTNKSDKIPVSSRNHYQIENLMLKQFMPLNRPSIEYFWNRVIPAETRMQIAHYIFLRDVSSFVLFVLPKLDHLLPVGYFDKSIHQLISRLFKDTLYNKEVTLSTWKYFQILQNAVTGYGFALFVLKMLEADIFYKEDDYLREWRQLCCEIWNISSEKLKRSAFENITSNYPPRLEFMIWPPDNDKNPSDPKEFEFLSDFLSYATSEEKRNFWFNYLHSFRQCQDWLKIRKLCFENEDGIIEFKNDFTANSKFMWQVHCSYSCKARFYELNEFANFLWPNDVQAARKFKGELLELSFFGRCVNVNFCSIIERTKEFNEFIDDAYGNADSSMDFKNRLTSSPEIQRLLAEHALGVTVGDLSQFLETIAFNERSVLQIKSHIIDELKVRGTYVDLRSDPCVDVGPLLSWCLGNEEEVEKFLSETDLSRTS